MPPIEPGEDIPSLGPQLSLEMLKPPFRPAVAGRIAFWLGPIAGALVSVISLRRMNCPAKANRIFLWTLLAAIVLAILFIVTPDAIGRIIGIGADIFSWRLFPRIQNQKFEEWQQAHPDITPSNGWRAMGWGLVGLLLFLIIAFAVATIISTLFPGVFGEVSQFRNAITAEGA